MTAHSLTPSRLYATVAAALNMALARIRLKGGGVYKYYLWRVKVLPKMRRSMKKIPLEKQS